MNDNDPNNSLPKPFEKISPLTLLLAGTVLVGIALVLLYLAAPVLSPIFFALFLAALTAPIYGRLQNRGLKSGLALLLLVLMILAAGIGLALLTLVSVQHLQESLVAYSEQLSAEIAEEAAQIGGNEDLAETLSQALAALMASLLAAMVNIAADLIFSVVLVVFMLLERDRFARVWQTHLRERPVLGKAPALAQTAVRYFGIRTRLNMVTGISMTILLLILGVDYPLLWGAWGFLLSYIPYVGLAMAMIPPTILAWAESGPLAALLVIVGITAINMLIENVLEPSYTGKQLRLSPTAVLVSVFFWTWLLGPIGALLSMPIAVLLVLVLGNYEGTRWLAALISRGEE